MAAVSTAVSTASPATAVSSSCSSTGASSTSATCTGSSGSGAFATAACSSAAAAFAASSAAICCCRAASSLSLSTIRRFRSSMMASVSESLSLSSAFSSVSASSDSLTSARSFASCSLLGSVTPAIPSPASAGATRRSSGSPSGGTTTGAISGVTVVSGIAGSSLITVSGLGVTAVARAPRASSHNLFCCWACANASSLVSERSSDESGKFRICPRFSPLILPLIKASGFARSRANIICCTLTELSGRIALAIDQRVSPVTAGP